MGWFWRGGAPAVLLRGGGGPALGLVWARSTEGVALLKQGGTGRDAERRAPGQVDDRQTRTTPVSGTLPTLMYRSTGIAVPVARQTPCPF